MKAIIIALLAALLTGCAGGLTGVLVDQALRYPSWGNNK
jgi:hypothetical protein